MFFFPWQKLCTLWIFGWLGITWNLSLIQWFQGNVQCVYFRKKAIFFEVKYIWLYKVFQFYSDIIDYFVSTIDLFISANWEIQFMNVLAWLIHSNDNQLEHCLLNNKAHRIGNVLCNFPQISSITRWL